MASADLGDPGKRSEVHLHIQSISPDQAVLIWSLSGFTISNLASADEKLDLISKSVRAPDIHVPKNALETLQKHRAMTMKKSPSKGLSEWDYLVFRSKKAPNTLKAVTASDIIVKLNGVVCPKADVSINMKKQHLSIKLAPSEEYEVVVTVSDIGSEAVRVATPKKVAPDKRRGGPLYFKPTTYRSVGVSAVDTSTPSDCCCSGVSNSETAIIVENQPLRNARFTRLDSLKKELHYLQNEYKSGLANLKKLKRDFTRVSYNVKSEIDACQHNLIKDVSIEHKTKQRFQMIQDFLQANETWIKSIGDERFETVAEAKKLKDGELRALTNEIHRLRETIKNSEKNYSKQTSHMAKSITVASAEISALLKIHDEGQKELKLVDGDLSSLKNIELSRIECKIDNAWSKQSEIRENIEQIVKDRERIIVEKKHSLKSLRLTCESLHTKNNDFGQLLKEKRVKNDRLCEELMKFEDGIKDDRPAKGNRKSRKPKLMEDYSSNQTWNMENMNW
ncbi:hypothetical protein BC830DRAFT_634248 [Chytriomyces sp. MP71]|nr:hypothetical protein BC830DRAFT_634248 [Chytriomyces sp. MP71]